MAGVAEVTFTLKKNKRFRSSENNHRQSLGSHQSQNEYKMSWRQYTTHRFLKCKTFWSKRLSDGHQNTWERHKNFIIFLSSGSHWIGQSSNGPPALGSDRAVIGQSLSSDRVVIRQSSSSHWAVIKQSSVSQWAVIRQSLRSHQAAIR